MKFFKELSTSSKILILLIAIIILISIGIIVGNLSDSKSQTQPTLVNPSANSFSGFN